MRITIHRRGGFAGIDELVADLETGALTETDREMAETAVRHLGFFGLAPTPADEMIGADMLRTELTVEDADRVHRVAYTDQSGNAAEPLRRFVERIKAVAR
ncbi:MAG: protealysin inhibitor emfourin [Pseudomonadota bacterium]